MDENRKILDEDENIIYTLKINKNNKNILILKLYLPFIFCIIFTLFILFNSWSTLSNLIHIYFIVILAFFVTINLLNIFPKSYDISKNFLSSNIYFTNKKIFLYKGNLFYKNINVNNEDNIFVSLKYQDINNLKIKRNFLNILTKTYNLNYNDINLNYIDSDQKKNIEDTISKYFNKNK